MSLREPFRASESLCHWAIKGATQTHTFVISDQATKQTSVTVLNNLDWLKQSGLSFKNNHVCLFSGVGIGPGRGNLRRARRRCCSDTKKSQIRPW